MSGINNNTKKAVEAIGEGVCYVFNAMLALILGTILSGVVAAIVSAIIGLDMNYAFGGTAVVTVVAVAVLVIRKYRVD